ncbi:putative 2-hydroxyacid dehydrogenase [Cladorrhinum sp. PSN332]|nr:putative 2-hydroxyacid dehydrogenase [Cladorrhinum sp. PSN332]
MGSTTANSNDILLMAVPLPRDDKWIAKIETQYPGIKEVRWAQREWKISPDPLPEDVLDGVTLLCTGMPIGAEQVGLLQKVRYVQLLSAGADRWISNPLYQNPDVTFCTSNGTHPPQIAEWVIGTWLMMGHHFLAYAEEQKKAKWSRLTELQIQDSPGLRMGILGYGAIGRQCARLGQALGMQVYAYTRSEKSTPELRKDDSYCVPGTGDPDGLIPKKWFHGASKEAVNTFLAQDLDLLVLSLPLTEASKYILGPEQFEILSKKKTFVSNIARGQHIDTDALLDALQTGKIRGAALDVTDPEPLPDGHPLFTAPNVFITPHVSWKTPHYFERVQAIIERNLDALRDGTPLINVMNKEHHY